MNQICDNIVFQNSFEVAVWKKYIKVLNLEGVRHCSKFVPAILEVCLEFPEYFVEYTQNKVSILIERVDRQNLGIQQSQQGERVFHRDTPKELFVSDSTKNM